MKCQFYIRYHTKQGESLWVSGNTEELGNNQLDSAIRMEYFNNDYWLIKTTIKRKKTEANITYRYFLKNEDGTVIEELSDEKTLPHLGKEVGSLQLIDTWNYAGQYENVFFSAPFQKVLLNYANANFKKKKKHKFTHIFKIKAPLLKKNEAMCILGDADALNGWDISKPIVLEKEGNWWVGKLDLSDARLPVAYKYGVFDTIGQSFVKYEGGSNRILQFSAGDKSFTILHDGFAQLPNDTWKGAGVAIPVFSLRSKNGLGVGEFDDIRLLSDWAHLTGLKLIQLLPVNDTTATNTWLDSYPYAAISAFALHPLYINLQKVAGREYAAELKLLIKKQKELNKNTVVDYEKVMALKISVLKELYIIQWNECKASSAFIEFYNANQHWLMPYSAFCYLRDKNGTTHVADWSSNKVYEPAKIAAFFEEGAKEQKAVGFYCFVQYHLHLQLTNAVTYAKSKNVVIKGDIPIGIYRYGCDAWVSPDQYNMNWQAGAPPDDFTAAGQNWGFPTYNWKNMQADGFTWWKQRFEQMSYYFDAFRIDHILGFFRIWSIPLNAVEGILGRFVPSIPIHINEFGDNGIWFDYQRFCRPYITDEVLDTIFGELAPQIKKQFLAPNQQNGYQLQQAYENQLAIETYFQQLEQTETNRRIKNGLFALITNVILLEDRQSPGQEFHFRISMENTQSFQHLIPHVQEKLKNLYIDYFYHRQDEFWRKEAMQKLPQLKAATNMLVCGEDLGMVPHCVPEVMQQLGILSLEIQRMPKDPATEFFNPAVAPYLSVITPSTHDMSTIRGWWEEDREKTQEFYKKVLGQWGDAPHFCEAWINKTIIMQHLSSPAIWSIFQLQDLLGMSEKLRRKNPQEERINNPANSQHYWQYRMHLTLEELIEEDEFNKEIKESVENAGR